LPSHRVPVAFRAEMQEAAMVVQRQLAAPATSAGDPICGLRTMAHDKVFCVVHMGT